MDLVERNLIRCLNGQPVERGRVAHDRKENQSDRNGKPRHQYHTDLHWVKLAGVACRDQGAEPKSPGRLLEGSIEQAIARPDPRRFAVFHHLDSSFARSYQTWI